MKTIIINNLVQMEKVFTVGNEQKTFKSNLIGINKYRITIFSRDTQELQIEVSLQPSGDDQILPSYRLNSNIHYIPKEIELLLPDLSDWLLTGK